MTRRTRADIRQFILEAIPDHPGNIASLVARRFGVSRQSANNHLRALTSKNLIRAVGKTRARAYALHDFINDKFSYDLSTENKEDVIWRNDIFPIMRDVPANILEICQYGFTEIFNNAVDHSSSHKCYVWIKRNAIRIEIRIIDNGIGIFAKIQNYFSLSDPRHALLELSKGKITSDPENHTGEGIFFTSRMFEEFTIYSGSLFFMKRKSGDNWLIDVKDKSGHFPGTWIGMEITIGSQNNIKDTFAQFEDDDRRFSRTHVHLLLAKYEGEQLISRSQARRLVNRVDRFDEAILDFGGVEVIGRAFADEIFRVYQSEHPRQLITPMYANADISAIIESVKADYRNQSKSLQ